MAGLFVLKKKNENQSIQNQLKKKITSLKIGGTNNTQNKSQSITPTQTHQKKYVHEK